MQQGKHYTIEILGTTYYAVCVGTDEENCYLKDINGNMLVVSLRDELAFSTTAPTLEYKTKLDELYKAEIDKSMEVLLEEAFAAKQLITADMPLNLRRQDFDTAMIHLQNTGKQLQQLQDLLMNQQYMEEQQQSLEQEETQQLRHTL